MSEDITKKLCAVCEKQIEYGNTCGWECTVALTKRNGGRVIAPNGLPVRSIKPDGTMLEHEHGDHPDYKFPVEVKYTGKRTPSEEEQLMVAGRLMSVEDLDGYYDEAHALIYTDGSIAITIFECCYAMWYLRDGECAGGSLWERGERSKEHWKLDEESCEKVRKLAKQNFGEG